MTLEEIKKYPKPFLTAAQIAPIVGSDPQTIRDEAHCIPCTLGYPVSVTGTRVRIPKIPFLKFIGEHE